MPRINMLATREGLSLWPLPGRKTIIDPHGRFELHVYGLCGGIPWAYARKVGPWLATLLVASDDGDTAPSSRP